MGSPGAGQVARERGAMADTAQPKPMGAHTSDSASRRDFLTIAASAVAGVGAAVAVWPLIDSMEPAKDTLALSTTEVDLGPVQVGQRLTVKWQGKPGFIDHRPEGEIKAAQKGEINTLRDPEPDSPRAKNPEWRVAIAVRPHHGAAP